MYQVNNHLRNEVIDDGVDLVQGFILLVVPESGNVQLNTGQALSQEIHLLSQSIYSFNIK